MFAKGWPLRARSGDLASNEIPTSAIRRKNVGTRAAPNREALSSDNKATAVSTTAAGTVGVEDSTDVPTLVVFQHH